MIDVPRAVVWSKGALSLLDQTRLPHDEVYLDCDSVESVHSAIARLSVRGAPAIGIAAAYGLIVGLDALASSDEFLQRLEARGEYLIGARPTAVNLAWAVRRMLRVARAAGNRTPPEILELLEAEAIAIHDEDRAACRAIGEAGLPLVRSHPHLLTHCNAGSLAVSELGTALAPIYLAAREGTPVHVFVDETRPLLQGARLTAWELSRAGVDNTLITDNMAATVMASGRVDAVIVGADRVAANGDVANKIGTMNLAILCQYFGLPFYVACPVSTIDADTPTGADIVVEERAAEEVTGVGEVMHAATGTRVFNPAFDVTPARLVTAIITERGVAEPPFDVSLKSIVSGP